MGGFMRGRNRLCAIAIVSVLFSILGIVFLTNIPPQTTDIPISASTGEIVISEYELAQEDDVQMEFKIDSSMAMEIAIDKANHTDLYSSPIDFKMHAIGMSFINGNLYYGFAQYSLSEEARIATLYIDATTGKAYFFHLNHSGYNTLIEME